MKRRRWKSNATIAEGPRRRSVAVDVEGRRGDRGGWWGKARVVGNDTEGNKNQTSTRHRTLTV